ncbi:MAG TPA: vWA domain-containing protein [Candidatus Kapabacteria bacterium]|nr:vWA domain-containing protein [Candidatus Kapabacteria bacterium]
MAKVIMFIDVIASEAKQSKISNMMSVRNFRLLRRTIVLLAMTIFANAPAQPILGPSVSLRTKANLKLITRFDNDTLYLRAWDKHGTEKDDLDSTDPIITRGNDTASIVRFEHQTTLSAADLAISFVLDNSGSMRHSYDSLTKYLDVFLDSLGDHLQTSAIVFDYADRDPTYDRTARPKLFLASNPFTTDNKNTKTFWHFFDTIRSKYTPLFDAMWKSLEHISDRRKSGDSVRTDVMIVVTDGEDNCSEREVTDLKQFAAVMNTAIYFVNFNSYASGKILWLINHTYGKTFSADDLPELREVIMGIRRLLSSGYRIVFKFPFSGAGTRR